MQNGTPVPRPGDDRLVRGQVYLESATWQQQGGRWGLLLRGNLPTPCHELRVSVAPPDAGKVVQVQVYSVVAPDQMCIQVLKPFETFVALDFGPDDGFQVKINGTPLEEIGSTR